MNLQVVGCGGMDWIELAEDRGRWWALVKSIMNLRVPYSVGNFFTSCKPVSFSRRTLLMYHCSRCYFFLISIGWILSGQTMYKYWSKAEIKA
jgi:hypothetical protein